MSATQLGTYWYRVAKLKPALRDATQVSRHVYRGEPWYILRNGLNGKNLRFNAAAYSLIGQMDGQQTVQQIWENAENKGGEAVPTKDEVILLLSRLHGADLIQGDILPSMVELFRQVQDGQGSGGRQRMSNPFYLRFPLVDPDRFLSKWAHLFAPLFCRLAFALWMLTVLSALVSAAVYWPELLNSAADRWFLPGNLFLLWMIFPLIKIVHEYAHAFAVKHWGGEVHEMGIVLLAFTPIPYVDATASASFPDKWQRIFVAAAGMMAELTVASLALFIWLNVESGLVSTLSFNVMLIGGVSTVLFNGNPLLRYDGYYILADLIEIPNLAQRSTRYLGYLLQRYLFAVATAVSPITAPGERIWFLVYGPISFVYRIAILSGLVWLVSDRFFVVGILIAVWGLFGLLILPAARNLMRFLHKPEVRNRRSRVICLSGAAVLALALALFVVPMPLWTVTQGVVWMPEQAVVRAGTDCEVVEVLARSEQPVVEGELLINGVDPYLETEVEVYRTRLEELYARYNAQPLHERVRRKMLMDEIAQLKADLLQAETKLEKRSIRSPLTGNFVLFDPDSLTGRFIKQGDVLGYIVAEHRPTIRTVVSQADIGLLREKVTGVEIRLAEQVAQPFSAEIERIIPAASLSLPSAALGTTGGGMIAVDPVDPDGLRAMESHFQIDINLPLEVQQPHIGARAYVRFEHGSMPLAMQWYRGLKQLLLRKFYV